MQVWGCLSQEGPRGLGICTSYKMVERDWKGKSCRGEGGSFLLLQFVEKSKEHSYQLGRIRFRKQLCYART